MRRWSIVVLLALAVVINYVDRQTLSVLGPTLLKVFHLSSTQYGWIVFWFSLAYMTGAPLTGRFLDRVGVRTGLALAVTAWSLVAAAHMAAAGFLSLCVLRVALGLSEAAIFPAGIKGASRVLPLTERATGQGMIFAGSSTGAALAPLIVVPLALHYGWRLAFLITGLAGFIWLAVWWSITRFHGVGDLGPESPHETAPVPASDRFLWRDPRLWAFLVGVFCVALPIAFSFFWLSLYMVKARGMTLVQFGHLAWIPYISSQLGNIGLGWFSGRLIHNGWSVIAARRNVILWASLLAFGQPFIPFIGENWIVLLLFSLAGITNGGLYTLYYAYITDHFPARRTGLLTGLGTMAYSACATFSGPVIGWTVDHFSYTPVLIACGLSPLTGALVWYALGAREFTAETQRHRENLLP